MMTSSAEEIYSDICLKTFFLCAACRAKWELLLRGLGLI